MSWRDLTGYGLYKNTGSEDSSRQRTVAINTLLAPIADNLHPNKTGHQSGQESTRERCYP